MNSLYPIIFLAEDVPSKNKGEVALLYGIKRTIRKRIGSCHFVLYSSFIDEDRKSYPDVELVGNNSQKAIGLYSKRKKAKELIFSVSVALLGIIAGVFGKKKLLRVFQNKTLRAYLKSDLILFGHDNFIVGPSLSFTHVSKVIFARLTKTPIFMVAGSFGPFKRGITSRIASWVLRNTDFVTLREPLSVSYCESMIGKSAHVQMTADAAFLLQAEALEVGREVLVRAGLPVDRPIVGLTVAYHSVVSSKAFEGKVATEKERHNLHTKTMAGAVDFIVGELGCSVVFIPHCVGPLDNDDRLIAREVYEQVENKSNVWLIEDDLSAATLKSVMGNLDMFIGERTHSVIGATGMYVPSIALSFPQDFRTYGILGEMVGLQEWLYDVSKMEIETFCSLIRDCWEHRHEIKKYLEVRIPTVVDNADKTGQFLAQLLLEKGM